MSNRDALRTLSRKMPSNQEVKAIVGALKQENDRAAAIVAASLLESTLEHALIESFKSSGKDLVSRLFENRGPLSDFNGKILVAQAFGVISSSSAKEFQAVRHIRNAFAHARLTITFETPEIKREVERFISLVAINKELTEKMGDELASEAFGSMPPKIGFLAVIQQLLFLHGNIYGRSSGESGDSSFA